MKYLGVDFGLRRIGLAVSEGELASPWQIIEVKNFADAIKKTSQVVKDGEFNKVIVGLPEGKMGKNVIGFVKALNKLGLDVETTDETLSSHLATEQMIDTNISQKARRVNDAQAAAIILQDYLDSL